MSRLPRDPAPDSTLALLPEGYDFIPERCRRLRSDIFETRLMLRRAVCIQGEDAARVFYHPGRFTRRGALPPTTVMLLQDYGSVQTLDGEAHRRRKAMFMAQMTPESIGRLVAAAEREWHAAFGAWETMRRVVLPREAERVLCRAACAWTGVPLPQADVEWRTRQFASMFDGAGGVGPRNWRGMVHRAGAEAWIRHVVEHVVEGVRSGRIEAAEGGPAAAVARYRDPDGKPLDAATAAVELINLLRPVVAVARFIVFVALALHDHPDCRRALEAEDGEYLRWFVQEVRRFYPFFPLMAGRVLQPFEWRGHRFTAGDWVLLDLYGTNRDGRTWTNPGAFRPERFRGRDVTAYDLVPQGGGDFLADHRCAGEWATIALMESAARLLTRAVRYDVPRQDLRVSLSRMPAGPASGFVLTDVRRVARPCLTMPPITPPAGRSTAPTPRPGTSTAPGPPLRASARRRRAPPRPPETPRAAPRPRPGRRVRPGRG